MERGQDSRYPSVVLTTTIAILLTVGWGYLRLFVFHGTFPVSFVLPLLMCVWTRRRWQLTAMGISVILLALIRAIWRMPQYSHDEKVLYIVGTVLTALCCIIIVRAILALRERLDLRSETIAIQKAQLDERTHELQEQILEGTHQTQILAQQNRELREANDRLESREGLLHVLLQSSRSPELGQKALVEVCQRTLGYLGHPAEALAVLELQGSEFHLWAQATVNHHPPLPRIWPLKDSLGAMVLRDDKTSYISQIHDRPDTAAPFGPTDATQSLLATPLRAGGKHVGLLVASSRQSTHWTQEQFRVIEWVAAQCALIADGLRWQKVLTDRTQELESANRAKDQFLAMLSHELRTPLTPVLAAASALEVDERLPVDARSDLGMIRRNIAIQSRLIDDLLDLTKVERGKLDLEKHLLNLPNLIRETATIVASDVDAREQTLTLKLGAIEGCYIIGDGARLQQVFWNLLKNAVKFSPPKGSIVVSGQIPAGLPNQVTVEVADSGVGLSEADLRRIFLPFEQVASEGRRRGADAGLGLGLAIAKAVVDLHHGCVQASSQGIGRGARFIVQLPLTVAAPPTTGTNVSPRRPAAAQPPARRAQILLVEDHGDTGRIMSRLLRNAGYVVDHAENSGSALRLFQDKIYDLVVSDLGLPDESGLELMKKIRAIRPETPGICLSGYGMEEDLKACQEAGFAEHLTKPVDMQRLRAAITRVVNGTTVLQ